MSAGTEVILDAQPLSSVAAASGIGSYTRHLLAALGRCDDVSVRALCSSSVTLPQGVEAVTISRLAHHPRLELWEHALRLPLDVRSRREGEVFHNPAFHAPFGVRSPWVQSLHDVIPLVFDAADQAALRARWKRFGPRYRRADAVIAVSQHAADEGARVLGLDRDRVFVVPHGVSEEFRPGAVEVGGRPYLLVVGEYSQRKGFDHAFAVLDALVDAGYPHQLVVAGQVHDWARPALEALLDSTRHRDRIDVRGYVPDLVSLYQGASVFLMTSRYEGFGMPVLEAMACGVPVVAFDNTSVGEIARGAGRLIPDGDNDALVAAVRQVLDSEESADELSSLGVAHARTFTWERSAAIHVEVYRFAAERH